jgi:hypothetical protein
MFRCPHLFYTRTCTPFKLSHSVLPLSSQQLYSVCLSVQACTVICFNCGDVLAFLELMLPYICELQLLLLEVNRTPAVPRAGALY